MIPAVPLVKVAFGSAVAPPRLANKRSTVQPPPPQGHGVQRVRRALPAVRPAARKLFGLIRLRPRHLLSHLCLLSLGRLSPKFPCRSSVGFSGKVGRPPTVQMFGFLILFLCQSSIAKCDRAVL